MKGVFLDTDSIAPQDLQLAKLTGLLQSWDYFPSTDSAERSVRIQHADIVVTNKIPLDAATIAAAEKLKLIQVAATGVNNIDLEAARHAGIAVTNVQGYSTASVAQHCFTLILALATNLERYQKDVASGCWSKNHFFCLLNHPITELAGKNLLIIGYGEIGKAVAAVAKGFGMNVMICQSLRDADGGNNPDRSRLPLKELLPQADVVSLHCPLTSRTENIIDARALSLMKPSALLINVSRGGLVDENALVTALEKQQIAGAGIDTLTNEPPVEGNPLLAQTLPNLIVTPHCAWGSHEARQRLVDEMVLNISAFLKGKSRNRLV